MRGMVDFLAVVQPQPRDGERIEARYITAGRPPDRRFYPSRDALARDAAGKARRGNVYYGVTLRCGGGTAEHCTRAGALWCDIDAKLWPDAPDPLRAALDAIAAFPLPASAVVCSAGGFHAYWRLETPAGLHDAQSRANVECLNAALARAVCGPERTPDHVQDVARILRLPGTFNHKTQPPRPVTLDWLRAERAYTLGTIAALLDERYAWATRPAVAPISPTPAQPLTWAVPSAPCQDALERAVKRLSHRLRALLDAPGTGTYKSASEADAAVATALIGAGLTASEALAVLLGSRRATDHAARKHTTEEAERAYWQRTVSRAAAHVGAVVEMPRGRMRSTLIRRAYVVTPVRRTLDTAGEVPR